MPKEVKFIPEATADCPYSTIVMSGLSKDESESLLALYDYSDGYALTLTIFNDGLFLTNSDYGLDSTGGVGFQFGKGGLDPTLDIPVAPFGSYYYTIAHGSTNEISTTPYNFFVYYAADGTPGNANIATGDKYGEVKTGSVSDGDAWVANSYASFFYYMPAEAATETEIGETVAGEGDRLNKGDELILWTGHNGSGTITAACNADDLAKVVLGAATLTAGSAAFATALAF